MRGYTIAWYVSAIGCLKTDGVRTLQSLLRGWGNERNESASINKPFFIASSIGNVKEKSVLPSHGIHAYRWLGVPFDAWCWDQSMQLSSQDRA